MFGIQTAQRHYLNLSAPDGASMNWSWQTCRKAYLAKVGKVCECCGSTKSIEVHHKLPRHIRPDLALDHDNLIALCGGGRGCHFHIGHLNSYFTYNAAIEIVAWYVKQMSVKMKNEAA